jgi:hypothetical protein
VGLNLPFAGADGGFIREVPMDEKSGEFVMLAKYPTIFEAERAQATLESAGIPAMVQSHGGGAFGPGFQGPVVGGASVIVRAADVERAWTLVVDTE